jgi:hypothetical protein
MRNKLVVFSVTAILLLLSLERSTYAHHGIAAWFDMTRSIAVKGTVTGFEWTNPHAYIYLEVKKENGAVEKWTGEMGGLPMLARAGWRRDTVKPGDETTLIGKPSKDGKPAVLLDKVVLANGQELAASDRSAAAAADQAAKPPKQ